MAQERRLLDGEVLEGLAAISDNSRHAAYVERLARDGRMAMIVGW
jgi:hypothetical protein